MEISMTLGWSGYLRANPWHALWIYFRDNSRMSPTRDQASRKALFSVTFALVAFFLGFAVEAITRSERITGWELWIDNIAAALLVGLVVFIYELRREREFTRKLQMIKLMNHHVRNALQPVMYLPYSQDRELQLNTIRDAIQRIDWALREILPGDGEDDDPPRQNAA